MMTRIVIFEENGENTGQIVALKEGGVVTSEQPRCSVCDGTGMEMIRQTPDSWSWVASIAQPCNDCQHNGKWRGESSSQLQRGGDNV